MTYPQIIAFLEERLKLASTPETQSAYLIVLEAIKKQQLYTESQVRSATIHAFAISSRTYLADANDFDEWWKSYRLKLIEETKHL